MRRAVLIASLLAGLIHAAPALAGETAVLMPGVTYSHQIQFTPRGPVSMYVITAPRPGGLYALRPILSNGTILGRQTVSSMERSISSQATSVGVNGDFFNWVGGWPTGILVRDGVLDHHSASGRSSIGVDADGNLHVDRVTFSGTWTGSDAPRPIYQLNEPEGANGTALYTPAWGAATPKVPGAYEIALDPFPEVIPFSDLTGTVVQTAIGGGMPIPPGGAVLSARGTQAPRVSAEAPNGTDVTVLLSLKPDWSGMLEALGGGPVLVRDAKPVFRAYEDFTDDQVFGRDPRTAVGQRADGKIVIVAVDGRQGYSVGITNFDLAQTLVRLGCITGSALDSGGSTTVAFDGTVLNRPSDPTGERPVAEALLVTYAGVYAPPPATPVVSPNGDGVGEKVALSYKLVRPATVSASLVGPDGVPILLDSGDRPPGTYRFTWRGRTGTGAPELEGRWQWVVTAVDDEGQTSNANRGLWLDNTLGSLVVRPSLLALRPRGGAFLASFRLTHAARVRVTVESTSGDVLRTLVARTFARGRVAVLWDGRDGRRALVFSGHYVLHVAASNQFGRSDLSARFTVRRLGSPKFAVVRR